MQQPLRNEARPAFHPQQSNIIHNGDVLEADATVVDSASPSYAPWRIANLAKTPDILAGILRCIFCNDTIASHEFFGTALDLVLVGGIPVRAPGTVFVQELPASQERI